MRCICCDNKITPGSLPRGIETHEDMVFKPVNRQYPGYNKNKEEDSDSSFRETAGSRMWNDGLVSDVSAGYGSRYDGGQYVIAICDDCLEKKMNDGTIAVTGNYIYSLDKEEMENYKRIWRRSNNLDELI